MVAAVAAAAAAREIIKSIAVTVSCSRGNMCVGALVRASIEACNGTGVEAVIKAFVKAVVEAVFEAVILVVGVTGKVHAVFDTQSFVVCQGVTVEIIFALPFVIFDG